MKLETIKSPSPEKAILREKFILIEPLLVRTLKVTNLYTQCPFKNLPTFAQHAPIHHQNLSITMKSHFAK
jgi:hypothetical protein